MTTFRFCYKRAGYRRWRCRAACRRLMPTGWPLAPAAGYAAATAAWRRAAPVLVLISSPQPILKIGDFVIGAEGDPQLSGHPDIRY